MARATGQWIAHAGNLTLNSRSRKFISLFLVDLFTNFKMFDHYIYLNVYIIVEMTYMRKIA